jgi:hypothetical protein
MPPAVDFIAKITSEWFLTFPALDIGSSIIVLIEQFVWILAPIFLLVRVHAGVFAACYHIIVAFTTGIVFITWFFIPLAVSLPFSQIARRLGLVNQNDRTATCDASSGANSVRAICALVVPIAAALAPSTGMVYPPFHNYKSFGWRYPSIGEFGTLYRLGWQHPHTGQLEVFPLDQGGFLDFRQTALLDVYTRIALTSPATRHSDQQVSDALGALLDGTRGIGANGWLLGVFKAPAHLLGLPGDVDMRSIKNFYLLKAAVVAPKEGRRATLRLQVCGKMTRDHTRRFNGFVRYEECSDSPRP